MPNDEIDLFHDLELATGESLNWLIEQIFSDDNTELARAQLARLAGHQELPASLLALTYYRIMRRSIEAGRHLDYWRCCRMFEQELRHSGQFWRSTMALGEDWTTLGAYVRIRLHVFNLRCQLRAAILLPAGVKHCDTAVFRFFQLAYLKPMS